MDSQEDGGCGGLRFGRMVKNSPTSLRGICSWCFSSNFVVKLDVNVKSTLFFL